MIGCIIGHEYSYAGRCERLRTAQVSGAMANYSTPGLGSARRNAGLS
jgi:hypothetical protein